MRPLRFALLGENIGYSRSPEIFAAALSLLNIEGSLEICSVAREKLGTAVCNLRQEGFNGCAVTIPYKEAIIEYLDRLDEQAIAINAVNSVLIDSTGLTGFNTDGDGLTFMLQRLGPAGWKRALILGCGGAARATARALSVGFGVKNFVICGRNAGRLPQCADFLRRAVPVSAIETIPLAGGRMDGVPSCDLIVNCTPLGGPNHSDGRPVPDSFDWSDVKVYCDLNYNDDNPMLAEAESHGVVAIDGSVMLVAQALKSLELWAGLKVDFEPVYAKVFPDR